MARVLGLRTAIYKVPDFDEAVRWYSKAFGVGPYFNDSSYAGFDIGGYELGLMRDESPAPARADAVLAYWGVEDIEAAIGHFAACGAAVRDAPVNVGGAIVVAAMTDPWGNVIGLICNPDFAAA